MTFHRTLTMAAAAALVAAALPAAAQEAAWPSRTVTIIVPNDPGTGTDLGARLLAGVWSKSFGQSFVIENVPGAANTVGTAKAADAVPDGYTFVHAPLSAMVLAPLTKKGLTYSIEDFTPIGLTAVATNTLVVNPERLPFESFEALLEELKNNPGKYNFSSSGAGGLSHLMHELLMDSAGIEITHIPYTSSPEATKALVAGEVDLAIISTTPILPLVQSGELRALAVAQRTRIPDLPDVPSIREIVPAYAGVNNWNGFFAPAGTPKEIIDKMSAAMIAYLNSEEGKAAFSKIGGLASPLSSDEFGALIRGETDVWRKVIDSAGLAAR